MKLGLLNREQMSGSLAEAFDALIGQIQGSWNKEHLSSGGHKKINLQQYLKLGTRLILRGVVTEAATGLVTINSNEWRKDLTSALVVRMNPGAALSITGIPVRDELTHGQVLILMNVSAFDITLMHQNTGSTTNHRLVTPAGLNMIVPAQGGAALAWYDALTLRWRMFPWQAGLLTGTNTGDQLIFKTVAVSGQTDIVADTTADTLTFASGNTAVVLTTTPASDILTITVSNMVGDSGAGGVAGLVPAPAAGDAAAAKFLKADGTWAVPAGGGGGGTVVHGTCNGRLTLETGVPISTTDQTGKSTIYFTPFRGNQVALYDGAAWAYHTLTEKSLALSGLTSGKNYDVFLYNNAGTLTLELSAAWSTDTARTDAIALQDGVWVKSGTTTRRLVGTIRTTATTTTEDSAAKRFVWNAQNRTLRHMRAALETTDSWTYTTATWRQANANAANQLDYVVGLAEDNVTAFARSLRANSSNNNTASCGIGVDSTSTNSAFTMGANASSTHALETHAQWSGIPGIGRHFLAWLEYSTAAGTCTWYGDAGGPTVYQNGIHGTLMC